jgi:hypothetical protein
MKKLLFTLAFSGLALLAQAQTIWTENFQNYAGFGSTLTGGWQTSGPGGYKVYIRAFPDSNNKIVEIPLGQNKIGDSLITPAFGPLTANATLTFRSRMVDTYTGITATFNHIPAAGDVVTAYISSDGGNTYQFLQNLISGYPNSGTAMVNFSLPLNGFEGNSVKVKLVTTRTAGSWFACFDDFAATNLTSVKGLQAATDLQLSPNPSAGQVNVTTSGFTGKAVIEVFNILGSKLLSFPLTGTKTSLDLRDLKNGVYLVKVTEGKQTQLKRLVIN